ncbi:hypothetical protein BGZ58_005679 [Dissophora ornata]|nr:hypothetical protein BGZ58_005679 [Dissophora ornata]
MISIRTLRIIIATLTLTSFVSVAISKNIKGSSVSPLPDLATESFFQDSAHLGINIVLFVFALFMYYSSIVPIVFFSLGLNYGIRILTAISVENHGCEDPFFDNTRTRCWIQYGVSGCEILWSIMLMIETCILLQHSGDQKPNNQATAAAAVEEVQNSVIYQPDLSLGAVEENRGQITNASDTADSGAVELTEISIHTSTAEQDDGENEEEQLPKYTRRRPRDQPRIVDATHPPERLANAVATVLNSEAAEADPVATSASPPYTEQRAESTVINMTAEVLPPPPTYQP